MKVTVTVGSKHLEINLDDSIALYFKKQLDRPFRNHTIKSLNCFICGINRVELVNDYSKKSAEQICLDCKGEAPYILQRVTETLTFKLCKRAWYILNVYNPPTPLNIPALVGTVMHKIDEKLVGLPLDPGNLKKFVYEQAVNYINSVKDDLTKYEIDEKQLWCELEPLLENYALVMSIKLSEDKRSEGQLLKLWKKIFKEFQVLTGFSSNGIRLLIVGSVDKLYLVNSDTYLIRDDKTYKYIWRDNSLQLGGYKYCLEKMGFKTLDYGLIGYSRYFELFPHKCDMVGYINLLKDISKFITERKIPDALEPNISPCTIDECNYFNYDWNLRKVTYDRT